LNKGIKIAKGDYIARQDADDISHQLRIEKQVKFLNENLYHDIIGCLSQYIAAFNLKTARKTSLIEPNQYFDVLLSGNSIFSHGSAIFRREAIDILGGYNPKFYYSQDCELWLRALSSGLTIGTLNFIGYYFRIPYRVNITKVNSQRAYTELMKNKYRLGLEFDEEQLEEILNHIKSASKNNYIFANSVHIAKYWLRLLYERVYKT